MTNPFADELRQIAADVNITAFPEVIRHRLIRLAEHVEQLRESAVADPCADIPDAPVPEPYQPPPHTRARLGRKKAKNLYLEGPAFPEGGLDIGRLDLPEYAALVRDALDHYLIAVDRRRQTTEGDQ